MKQNHQWDEEFEQRLTQFLKDHLVELLTHEGLSRPAVVYEIELRERLVQVEEAIKHQGELIQKTLDLMDVRFNAMDKRFEAMDKRFEDLREDMNRRFEAVDRRFASMQWLDRGRIYLSDGRYCCLEVPCRPLISHATVTRPTKKAPLLRNKEGGLLIHQGS